MDDRLSLACSLYDPCELGADIGTDHGLLPAALLQGGICRRMILTDISPSALENARGEMNRCRLLPRVSLRLGDGLAPLEEACGMISIMGMGGRTIRDILLAGADRLRGASLLLSAHTDLPLIRQTVQEIGYHLDREEPVLSAGRFYLLFRARPGARPLSPQALRLGDRLFSSASPLLRPYLARRREILSERLAGLLRADTPDAAQIRICQEDLAFYDAFLEEEPS